MKNYVFEFITYRKSTTTALTQISNHIYIKLYNYVYGTFRQNNIALYVQCRKKAFHFFKNILRALDVLLDWNSQKSISLSVLHVPQSTRRGPSTDTSQINLWVS